MSKTYIIKGSSTPDQLADDLRKLGDQVLEDHFRSSLEETEKSQQERIASSLKKNDNNDEEDNEQ